MKTFELTIGKTKTKFVSGLSWHPLVPDSFKKELKPLSKDMGMDLYVYRKSNRSIIGLIKEDGNNKPGAIATALVVAAAIDSEYSKLNVLVAIQRPENPTHYIYVVIRDGFILADGDLIDEELLIQNRLREDMSVGGWDLVIAPDSWGVNNSIERTFESLLPQKKNLPRVPLEWRLKNVNVKIGKYLFPGLIIVGIIFGSSFAFKQWKLNELKKQQLLAMEQQKNEEEERQKAQKEALNQIDPWMDSVRSMVLSSSCDQYVLSEPMVIGNWSLSDFSCDAKGVQLKYSRNGTLTLISTLKEKLPLVQVGHDGMTAFLFKPFDFSKLPKPSKEIAPDYSKRLEYFLDLPMKYGIEITLQKNKEQENISRFQSMSVDIISKLKPSSIIPVLDGPAFRVSSISGSIKNGQIKYQIKGVQYAPM